MCAFLHKHERNTLAGTLIERWEKFGEAGTFHPGWTGGMTRILSPFSSAENIPLASACGKYVAAGVLARCYVQPSKLGFSCVVVKSCRNGCQQL